MMNIPCNDPSELEIHWYSLIFFATSFNHEVMWIKTSSSKVSPIDWSLCVVLCLLYSFVSYDQGSRTSQPAVNPLWPQSTHRSLRIVPCSPLHQCLCLSVDRWLHRPVVSVARERSPAWHRRLRANRAKARRLIRWKRENKGARLSRGLRRALCLLSSHHTRPRYREMYLRGWGGQQQVWGGWSPQLPRGGSKPKKKEDKPKERREEGLAKPYDLVPSSSQQSAGGLSPEAAFMKDFLEMAKEQKMEIPERLQKCLPDQTSDTRDSLKEQQRRINKHRNVLHKLENKKKAIEKDNERWNTWVNTMKQEIQQQKENHETVQKKLQKELNDLIDEEKKLREQEDHEIEEEDPKSPVDELEPLLEGAPLGPADHGGDRRSRRQGRFEQTAGQCGIGTHAEEHGGALPAAARCGEGEATQRDEAPHAEDAGEPGDRGGRRQDQSRHGDEERCPGALWSSTCTKEFTGVVSRRWKLWCSRKRRRKSRQASIEWSSRRWWRWLFQWWDSGWCSMS